MQSSSHFTTYTECSGYIMTFMSLRNWVWVYTRSGLKTALGGARNKLIFSWQNWNCSSLETKICSLSLTITKFFQFFFNRTPKFSTRFARSNFRVRHSFGKPSLMPGLRVAGSLTGACPLVGHIFPPPPAESARGLYYGK